MTKGYTCLERQRVRMAVDWRAPPTGQYG